MSERVGNLVFSRKILAFILLSIAVISCGKMLWAVRAPDQVITQAMWIIGYGGLFTIGGQALVDTLRDALKAYAEAKKPQ